jgi:hypothetical protein
MTHSCDEPRWHQAKGTYRFRAGVGSGSSCSYGLIIALHIHDSAGDDSLVTSSYMVATPRQSTLGQPDPYRISGLPVIVAPCRLLGRGRP